MQYPVLEPAGISACGNTNYRVTVSPGRSWAIKPAGDLFRAIRLFGDEVGLCDAQGESALCAMEALPNWLVTTH